MRIALLVLIYCFLLFDACQSSAQETPPGISGSRSQAIAPYNVGRHWPKLTTPQWVGEAGVDAVVILSIDDMREVAKYEDFLRPLA